MVNVRGARRRPRRASSRPGRSRGRPARSRAASGTSRARSRAGAGAPSSTLNAMPSPSRAAQSRPSAPPFAIQPVAETHQLRVRRAVATDQLGACAHRVGGTPTAGEALEPRECVCHPLERERVRHDAAAVDRRRHRARLDLRSAAQPRRASPAGTGAMQGDSPRSANHARRQRSSIAACFPEQLCSSREGSGPHSRSSSVASASASSAPHGLELIRPMQVRRARDRDLGIVEIGPCPHDRKRLDRLRRAAEDT